MWWSIWDHKKESFWVFTWFPIPLLCFLKALLRDMLLKLSAPRGALNISITHPQHQTTIKRFYIIDFAAFRRIQMIPEQLQVLQNSSVRVPGVLPLHSFAPVFPRNLLPGSGRESWHGWPSGLVWLTHGSPSLPSRAGIAVRRGTGRDGAEKQREATDWQTNKEVLNAL